MSVKFLLNSEHNTSQDGVEERLGGQLYTGGRQSTFLYSGEQLDTNGLIIFRFVQALGFAPGPTGN